MQWRSFKKVGHLEYEEGIMFSIKQFNISCLLYGLTLVTLILFLNLKNAAWGEIWQKKEIGAGSGRMYSVTIGQGRNDGVMRVYGGNMDNHVYEFTYDVDGWIKNDMGNSYYGDGVTSVTVGSGRYDGVNRVYATEYWNYDITYVDEFTYSASQWNNSPFYFSYDTGWDVALGNARNDGQSRVYVGGGVYDGVIKEFTYTSGKFTETAHITYGTTADIIRGIAVGDGRNDGYERVYGVSFDGNIYEYSYLDKAWVEQKIYVVPAQLRAIAIGYGRNDNVNRLYIASEDGHIYELTYQNGSWIKNDLGYGGKRMHGVAIGAGRNDGVMRVYGANEDGHIYEFSYSGGTWQKEDVGTGSSTMWGVTVGDGRNDGVIRVYGANEDGYIYEFSYFAQTHFEEDDPAISYTGTWNIYTCPSCSGGALKYSGQTGAKAEFSFTGTGIKWIVTKAKMLGKAKVYLDGVYMGMVDLYSPTPQYQVVLQKTGLSPGTHTGTIEVSGQKNPSSTGYFIDIDAFEVFP